MRKNWQKNKQTKNYQASGNIRRSTSKSSNGTSNSSIRKSHKYLLYENQVFQPCRAWGLEHIRFVKIQRAKKKKLTFCAQELPTKCKSLRATQREIRKIRTATCCTKLISPQLQATLMSSTFGDFLGTLLQGTCYGGRTPLHILLRYIPWRLCLWGTVAYFLSLF